MLKIFKYKKMYLEARNELAGTTVRLSTEIANVNKLNKQLEELTIEYENYRKKAFKDNMLMLESKDKKIQEKEDARRKNACKIGGLKARNNILLNERQQMLDLINKLIEENATLKKQRNKRPFTIEELKKYYRIY